MSREEIQELDATHGLGQGIEDLKEFIKDRKQEKKKPWAHPVNKSEVKMSDNILDKLGIDKALPKKDKRKGETKFQHKIRQWTEEVERDPKRFPGGHDQAIAIAAEQAGVDKAMTTSSFPVKAHDITRSAITAMTRQNSVLKAPEGVAPIVGDTLRFIADRDLKLGPVYKSCVTHGITFRTEHGCHPCSILKSSLCKKCGHDMHKSPGGHLMCKNCM